NEVLTTTARNAANSDNNWPTTPVNCPWLMQSTTTASTKTTHGPREASSYRLDGGPRRSPSPSQSSPANPAPRIQACPRDIEAPSRRLCSDRSLAESTLGRPRDQCVQWLAHECWALPREPDPTQCSAFNPGSITKQHQAAAVLAGL